MRKYAQHWPHWNPEGRVGRCHVIGHAISDTWRRYVAKADVPQASGLLGCTYDAGPMPALQLPPPVCYVRILRPQIRSQIINAPDFKLAAEISGCHWLIERDMNHCRTPRTNGDKVI